MELRTLGENVRRMREIRMLSQKELAQKARVAERRVGEIERGGNARVSTVIALADALLVPPADLLKEEPPRG